MSLSISHGDGTVVTYHDAEYGTGLENYAGANCNLCFLTGGKEISAAGRADAFLYGQAARVYVCAECIVKINAPDAPDEPDTTTVKLNDLPPPRFDTYEERQDWLRQQFLGNRAARLAAEKLAREARKVLMKKLLAEHAEAMRAQNNKS